MNEMMKLGMKSERVEQEWLDAWEEMRATTAMEPLKVELVAINDEHAVMEFEITDAARQPMGLLHGGISLMIGESVASMHSAWLCDLSVAAPVGVDINGTHLRSAREGRVRATARILRRTRTFVFHEVDIEHIEQGTLLCKVRISNFFRPHTH